MVLLAQSHIIYFLQETLYILLQMMAPMVMNFGNLMELLQEQYW